MKRNTTDDWILDRAVLDESSTPGAGSLAAILEAMRPRRSGFSQNTCTVRIKKEPEMDYVKMKEAIEGV